MIVSLPKSSLGEEKHTGVPMNASDGGFGFGRHDEQRGDRHAHHGGGVLRVVGVQTLASLCDEGRLVECGDLV